MSRGGIKISRVSESEPTDCAERVDWLDAFARKMKQNEAKVPANAVDAARTRDANSLFDQISSILSKKPIHSSVEEKVQDYQERIGLKEYISRMSAAKEEEARKKLAGEAEQVDLPDSFSKLSDKDREDIVNFIRNKCDTHHGNIQVPALIEEVSQTFRQRGVQPQDVNDVKFEKFVSDEIVKAKKKNPTVDEHNVNIGLGVGLETDLDTDNGDLFDSLMPVKTSL